MESSLYYLKEFGREEFQEKIFFGRIYAGKLCIIKHNLEYQLQKHSKKKDFREEQKSLQTYSNNNSWKFAEKVLSGPECSATESSVRTSLFFFCNFSCINEVPTLHNR